MKRLKFGFVFLCFSIISLAGYTQEAYSKVRVYATTLQERNELIGLLQIDHFIPINKGFVTEIGERGIQQLRAHHVRFEVLVADVARDLEQRNRKFFADRAAGIAPEESTVAIEQNSKTVDAIIKTPAAFEVKSTFGGYYSFAEMEAAMNTLVTTYPLIASKTSIGTTAEGRDIWLIKISDNVATDETNEPEVLYMGLQHAREAITGSSMIFFMQYLCENYASDSRIKDLVDNRELYIIPCFNPDGWEYNRTTATGTVNKAGGGWRKNRTVIGRTYASRTKVGTGNNATWDTTWTYEYGVDLNRNWGVDWSNCSAPISGPSSSCGSGSALSSEETYWGASAFSEKETQAVRDFTKAHHLVAGFDQHAYGPYYSLPFGRKELHTMGIKGQNFYSVIPALMGTYNGMRAADSYDALGYEVAGGFKDWMLMGELGTSIGSGLKDTVWAMTGEGAAGGGSSYAGTYSDFWAPASQITYLSKGMCYQNLQLAFAAGTYVDIEDANNIALTAKSGTLGFAMKRIGIGNDPVTITLVPLENMQTVGAPITINSMTYYQDYAGSISYTLPAALTNGQRIRFAWKITTGGITYSDTLTKFYNPTTLFSDDMEGSSVTTNWTVSSGWNYATDKAYAGTKALTESPGGNYIANQTLTATYKNTLNLSDANAAYLTFWTRYRAENFRDKLQVQVATNGTNWTAIPGKHTVQELGTVDGSTINGQASLTGIHDYWTQEAFDLSGYNGTAALSLRFVFTSDSDPSSFKYEVDDGFYIDNLSVMKSTATFGVLAVTYLNLTGKLMPDNTVALAWETAAEKPFDYFEIERATDGAGFITIAKAGPQAPFQFKDLSAKPATNYYRIKQVFKDGQVKYSGVVRIEVPYTVKVLVYPNPVQGQLSVQVSSQRADALQIRVTDLQGRLVYSDAKNVNAGITTLHINTQHWLRQTYMVTITNQKKEVLLQKIMKQ